jgi:hypothetical protein
MKGSPPHSLTGRSLIWNNKNPPPTALVTPDQLEEALEVGRACRDLLEAPCLQTVLDGLQAYHTQALVMTPEGPDGTAVREHHHRMIYALHELVADIRSRALNASEIEAQLTGEDED